jgi:hypothetical protein
MRLAMTNTMPADKAPNSAEGMRSQASPGPHTQDSTRSSRK